MDSGKSGEIWRPLIINQLCIGVKYMYNVLILYKEFLKING